jgi:hypothetical protein
MFLCFFGFGVLALEVGEGYVERFVTKPNSNRVHRYTFLMHCVGISLAEAVKLGALDASFLCNRLQLAQEVPVGLLVSAWKQEIVRLSVPLPRHLFDLPNQLCRDWNESVLGGLLFLFALEPEIQRPRSHRRRPKGRYRKGSTTSTHSPTTYSRDKKFQRNKFGISTRIYSAIFAEKPMALFISADFQLVGVAASCPADRALSPWGEEARENAEDVAETYWTSTVEVSQQARSKRTAYRLIGAIAARP